MNSIGIKPRFGEDVLSELRRLQQDMKHEEAQPKPSGSSFLDHMKGSINEVDSMQKTADKMAVDVASGQKQNLHETMLAATQAELSFNLMVQVRNRVLEAYQEVMRMQV